MSYLVLARKYRPQTLAEVVGQEHVTRTLANAFKQGRVHHAFLLCGPRGVGKTTLARILSKALNCERGASAEPCGECEACQAIAGGTAVDYYEMDGASNRGIDSIRDLTEAVKYQPAAMRKKVYVIDEVHMLTTEAFNALLKTLEEPPPHVTFILATTEPHKVPVTILSRCQRYDFKLVPAARLAALLRSIFERESFEVEPAAVDLLVRESGGSVRDALSLSDQVISYVGSREIREAQVAEVLGVADRALVRSLVQSLASGDARAALEVVDAAVERGLDEVQVARALTRVLHDIAVAQVDAKILEGSAEEQDELARLGREIRPLRVRLMCDRMMRACEDLADSPEPRIVVDLALIDLAALDEVPPISELVERLAELERRLAGASPAGGPSGGGARRAPASRPAASRGPAPATRASGADVGSTAAAPEPTAASASSVDVSSSSVGLASSSVDGSSSSVGLASSSVDVSSARASSVDGSSARASSVDVSSARASSVDGPSSSVGLASSSVDVSSASSSVDSPAATPASIASSAGSAVAASIGASPAGVATLGNDGGRDVAAAAGAAWAAEMSASLDGARGVTQRASVAPPPRGPEPAAPWPLPASQAPESSAPAHVRPESRAPAYVRVPESSASSYVPRGPEPAAARGPSYVPRGPEPGAPRPQPGKQGANGNGHSPAASAPVARAAGGPAASGSAGAAPAAAPVQSPGAAPSAAAWKAPADPLAAWGDVMAALEEARELTLLSWYQHAVVLRWDARGVELGFPAGAIVGDLATEPRNVQALGAFLEKHVGGSLPLSVRVLSESDRGLVESARSLVEAEADRRREEAARRSSEAREHPMTKMVLDTFGASIEEIKTDV